MKRIILTRGLPGSGKSTWSKQFIKDNQGFKRICKDDMRSMLDDGKWTPANEKFILLARDTLIGATLDAGYHVIVDDTNLHKKHEQRLAELFKGKATVEIKDFTDVPIEECIKRDLARCNSVGEAVIRKMYNQFLKPKTQKIEYDPSLPDAIICDLDGTLCLFDREKENPYERDFLKDTVNTYLRTILTFFSQTNKKIIITSGRSDKFREHTTQWLTDNQIIYDELFMRKAGDDRKDYMLKEEIYRDQIKDKFNVIAIFDDRKSVKRMWVNNGLFVFDVNQTDEEF